MSEDNSSDKVTVSKKKLAIVAIIMANIALMVAIFILGYNIGQDVGKRQATVDESIGAISSLIGNVANPAKSTSGKVISVSGSEITVETTTGEQRTAKITDETKITNKAKLINASDIKVDQRASIFFDSSQKEGEFASRIIVN